MTTESQAAATSTSLPLCAPLVQPSKCSWHTLQLHLKLCLRLGFSLRLNLVQILGSLLCSLLQGRETLSLHSP